MIYDSRSYKKESGGQGLPLIICLHGAGGTGSGFKTQLGFTNITSKAVFIYPDAKHNGVATAWNVAPGYNDEVDDLTWLGGLIEQVKIDENTTDTYLLGHSNGGMMAHRYGTVKGEIAKAFIFNSALEMLEDFNFTGELSLWKSLSDTTIPIEGNKSYRSLIYEYRQMQRHIADRSEVRLVGGALHNVSSFKSALVNLGTTLEAEVERFFQL
jgi:pimeloyl-ACP methyl ester carboxylesterase